MFFLIDKPLGITSFDVIRLLRKSLGIKKMGHAGTLDPLATGCLIIATEKSTKLLSLLDNCEKEYVFTVRLDGKSDSYDAGTPIVKTDTQGMLIRTDDEICDFLISQKKQIPPKYSALHIDGSRAYDLARKGVSFEIPERPIQITAVQILEREGFSIKIKMSISSGGYVRSFGPLLGTYFGIQGGYIEYLRRTAIYTPFGVVQVENAGNIENPREISYSELFHTIPTIEIDDSTLEDLILGRNIPLPIGDSSVDGAYFFLKNSKKKYITLSQSFNKILIIKKNDV